MFLVAGNVMFNIGEVIIYSAHGLSKIDDICEKTFSNVTKTYYVLHPLEQVNLTINTPVDNDKVVMLKIMEREEAEEILQSFQHPGLCWISNPRERNITYKKVIKDGDRSEIAKLANTLMRQDIECRMNNRKLYEQDRRLLDTIQNILFKELAASLDTSFGKIYEQVNNMINE
jgi:CarD family transcriptional regulator